MATDSPPTTEKGTVYPYAVDLPGWTSFLTETERAVELRMPTRIQTYDSMLNDTQLEGLYLACVMPIGRYRWFLDPLDARPEVVERMARDFRLGVLDEPAPNIRRRGRFNFAEHLDVGLKATLYGHYGFEIVAELYEDEGREWVRIRKLAARPPRTVTKINTERDGGLKSIQQGTVWMTADDRSAIDVSRLVWYVFRQDPGDWTGRSLFRSSFRNWAIKDRLLRVDALKQERFGMGTPVATGAEGDGEPQRDALLRTASRIRAGEQGAAYLHNGQSLTIEGVRGNVPDTIASIRYHDEQMAKAFLAMFMQAGMTGEGTRATAGVHLEFFDYAQKATADWFARTFMDYVMDKWMTWNYGPDEPMPALAFSRDDDEELPTADLAKLIQVGAITVDPELEDAIRARHKLPKRDPNTPQAKPTEPPPVPLDETPPAMAAAAKARERHGTPFARMSSSFRRELTETEIAAATDFEAMDANYVSARDELVLAVRSLQGAQVTELSDQIESAGGDLTALAALAATPIADDVIREAMNAMATTATEAAMAEARAQGRDPVAPATPDFTERAAAKSTVLAGTLSDAARRKALALTDEVDEPLDPPTVATKTREHLNGLTTAFLDVQLGDALTIAQNTARREVFRANPPKKLSASELLDANTCGSCAAVDGTEYADLAAAEVDYPTGAYANCEGGLYCRGTLLAEW